jgi:small subunit ribosomal protein S15
MVMTREERAKTIADHRIHDKDSGSVEVQCSLITHRITYLTEHLKQHRKDFHSRRGLQLMVSRRTRLLRYLARRNPDRYQALVKKLGLRR